MTKAPELEPKAEKISVTSQNNRDFMLKVWREKFAYMPPKNRLDVVSAAQSVDPCFVCGTKDSQAVTNILKEEYKRNAAFHQVENNQDDQWHVFKKIELAIKDYERNVLERATKIAEGFLYMRYEHFLKRIDELEKKLGKAKELLDKNGVQYDSNDICISISPFDMSTLAEYQNDPNRFEPENASAEDMQLYKKIESYSSNMHQMFLDYEDLKKRLRAIETAASDKANEQISCSLSESEATRSRKASSKATAKDSAPSTPEASAESSPALVLEPAPEPEPKTKAKAKAKAKATRSRKASSKATAKGSAPSTPEASAESSPALVLEPAPEPEPKDIAKGRNKVTIDPSLISDNEKEETIASQE